MTRNLDIPRARAHHRAMLRIRLFEEAAMKGVADGLVPGYIHPYIGQEAVAVGVCAHLTHGDPMLSTHRGHGHTIAKGANTLAMMRELFGREGGNCHGKGGSMHIADFGVGMLGANGVVAANLVIGVGAAQALKLTNREGVVVCFFGDGAINRGPFLEALNWAKVWNLPVLFVCEHNGYAAMTRTEAMTAGGGPIARSESLGIPHATVDGNDVLAVDETAGRLIAAARHDGPRFLLANTYRLLGHTGTDPAAYRPKGEADERWKGDPIPRLAEALRAAGVPESDIAADRATITEEIETAYRVAAESPPPPVSRALEDVQDAGDPRVMAY
jgi:acetoin:2,6-dichlorophenolindophenol oxidoreductase subunit alpha